MTGGGELVDAGSLIEVMTGYQRPAAVAAACRLGLFDELGDQPIGTPELARRLGAARVPLTSLLEVLVALGLAVAHPTGHTAGPLGSRLRSGGDLAAVVHKEALFARVWTELDATVRDGAPRLASWRERLVTEPDVARAFLTALVTLAGETGPDLRALPAFAPGRRVLDVGGGLGSHARPLADAGAEVTLVDLPEVVGWARSALAGTSVAVRPVDVLHEPSCGVPPGSVDSVLVSHLLHDLPDEDAAHVLREVRSALRPGGVVVVVELPGDGPGETGPLFDLMMQVETPGRARRIAELESLLEGAGFLGVHAAPYPRPVLVLVGERP